MGERLERALQRQLLEFLAEVYPIPASFENSERFDGKSRDVLVNIHYLHQHGLVEARFAKYVDGTMEVGNAEITHRGLDFLADDGGLGAILGVVTVKLHDDTIRDLLLARVDASTADERTKSKWRQLIGKMSSKALEAVVTEGVKAGLPHVGDFGAWLAHIAMHIA